MTELLLLPDTVKKVFAADKDGALAATNLAGKDLVAAVKKRHCCC
jgi:hypothetical protein